MPNIATRAIGCYDLWKRMNVRPLIVRELRAESRRANTYWMRALAAGLLTALFVWSTWNFNGSGAQLGPFLFQSLSNGFLLAALMIVAGVTADSISREKREGTLGLLFLTPLRAGDIVIGKTLLHAVRAISLFIAMAPIAGLPFLLGGIPLGSLLWFFCALLVVTMVAVASGLIATVTAREWIESIVWAELISFATVLFLLILNFVFGRIAGVLVCLIFSAGLLGFAIVWAGEKLMENWQNEEEESEAWWVRMFSDSDFWRAAFHWDTRKARDRNPIAWLQEYNWSSRLTKWGWCALLFIAQWKMLVTGWRQYMEYQMQLSWLVALGISFSAAASFRRERQTGALELLLVTPISAGKLVWGRLQGVWIHFFPAIAILACVWNSGAQFLSLPFRYSWYLAGVYFCIPIIGFYCSLLTSNVLVAWLLALFFGQYLPYAITDAFRFDIGRQNLPLAQFSIQFFFATIAGILLYENLVKRRFVLKT